MKKNIAIITILIFSVALSMFLLGYTEQRQREADEDFWSVYFAAPLSPNDHRFVVDNRSASETFHYAVISNEQTIASEEIIVGKKDHVIITPPEMHSLPFSIVISHDNTEQELTKK